MLHKCSTWIVARVFFNEPLKEHYKAELSRKSGLSHTSVSKHLTFLLEENIIEETIERRGEREFPRYFASMESEDYKLYKRIDILQRLKTSGLLDFLKDEFYPDCIILFGSASRGEDASGSDLDLFLQAEDKEVDLSRFEKDLNREVELHVRKDFKELPSELKNNILNGVLLHGFLEVF